MEYEKKDENSFEIPTIQNKKRILPIAIVIIVLIVAVVLIVHNSIKCSVSGCNNTRVSGGQYCSMHTCCKSGCYNLKSQGDVYCYLHKESDSDAQKTNEDASSVLVFSNLKLTSNSLYKVCSGTIKNTGKKTYEFVKIKCCFKDSSGNVVDTDWTYAVGSEGLSPNESSTFSLSVKKNSKIVSCSIQLLDYDVR